MTEISRRSFFATPAGAGSMLLAATIPGIATPVDGSRGVRAVYQGWNERRAMADFLFLERQRSDGSWATLRRPFYRIALVPPPVRSDTKKQHVSDRERVTLIGPSAFDDRIDAWETTAILNWKGELLPFTTKLERWRTLHAQGRELRERALARATANRPVVI